MEDMVLCDVVFGVVSGSSSALVGVSMILVKGL